ESIKRIRCGNSGQKAVDSGGLDKELDAVHFEIERVRVLATARKDEVAHEAERRLARQRVVHHRQQEPAAVLGMAGEPRSELRCDGAVALDWPEVEEDRRVEEGSRIRFVDPLRKTPPALRKRQTP